MGENFSSHITRRSSTLATGIYIKTPASVHMSRLRIAHPEEVKDRFGGSAVLDGLIEHATVLGFDLQMDQCVRAQGDRRRELGCRSHPARATHGAAAGASALAQR